MDMGCYPISLLRLLAAGPRVTGASAKLSSPGVDRAMDAHFSLPAKSPEDLLFARPESYSQ